MKEKIWSFGVPFVMTVAGCFVALWLYDKTKSKKAKIIGESESSVKAEK
jgi:hypothetical protein